MRIQSQGNSSKGKSFGDPPVGDHRPLLLIPLLLIPMFVSKSS